MKHIVGKTILIIGGGLLQCPIIETARQMKLRTVVADMNPDAPGFKISDFHIIMSTKDIEGMVREAKRFANSNPIHAVITSGTDASMTVSAVANSLGLPGIRYVDAEAASNKIKMRKRLKEHGVPIPDFAEIWNIQDARDALEFLKFPLVMKPADNMGARGVIKVNNREELHQAFKHSKKYTPSGEMILEEYMEGPEVSVDALTWNGNYRITGIADRLIEREPFFIEVGHNMPTSLPIETQKEIERVMFAGMKALGINLGAGKGDIKITPTGVKVGEIAARLSGGFMSSYTFPLSTGISLNRAAILIALGEEPDNLEPKWSKTCIERAILASPGKLISITGLEEAKEIPNVNEIFLSSKVGDIISDPTNNIEKSGHIIATADNLELAEDTIKKVNEVLKFESDDYYSLNEKTIHQTARKKFGKEICWVCKVCDGSDCASGVPGMGGIGRMETFQDNHKALMEYTILPRYIRENVSPELNCQFLGKELSHPIMGAPMTGATTNMNNAIDEYQYALTVLQAFRETGSLAWLGDGATPDKYLKMLSAIKENNGEGILICKPRADEGLLRERLKESENQRIFAVGMDIDAFQFRTMIPKNQQGPSRTWKELQRIRSFTNLPFILKGIMTVEDAKMAVDIGASAIVVSNHGGRVLDEMPGTARVLPGIADSLKGRLPILVDGGIRSGMDVFKMLALGADSVLLGRPVSIYAVGGEISGVKFLLKQYLDDLKNCMNISGSNKIRAIMKDMLLKK
ncbi:MAG: alpha-hydroxy-acid oxidizing protein [Leptospiraceae bacterium]|nr:alpha-hydroxy-acid oxidizing protein [Leptospiraceae bacterium]MCP5510609.1 alpha-hydroxy-acid oxidizing protein [Leptospiraceae bacterium]